MIRSKFVRLLMILGCLVASQLPGPSRAADDDDASAAPTDATPAADTPAADTPSATPAATTDGAVAATVGEQSIPAADVERVLAAAGKPAGPIVGPWQTLAAEALNQLVDQRLVEQFLASDQAICPTAEEIDAEIARLKERLTKSGTTFDAFLSQRGWNEQSLRDRVIWMLGWPKYVKAQTTDEALQTYFDAHHQHFDGSQVRVSHILLRAEGALGPKSTHELVAKARAIKKQIVDGELTFAQAAEKYSAGPSRFQGGDQGFIARRGVMVEPFSKAAFDLKKDEISNPVVTVFGVHLIQCTDVKLGPGRLSESRQQVEPEFALDLFRQVADAERKKMPIEFTGAIPYFKPGTRDLIATGEPSSSLPPAEEAADTAKNEGEPQAAKEPSLTEKLGLEKPKAPADEKAKP